MSDRLRASVDVGGSSVRVALGDASGAIREVVVDDSGVGISAERSLRFIAEQVCRTGDEIECVSVGFPGAVDESGAVRIAPNLDPSWTNRQVAAELVRRTGRPVFLANDACVAALGEWIFGAGRSLSSASRGAGPSGAMVYLGLGTGIGGGVVLGGKLHLGRGGCAGEIGHVVVQADGPACACGSRGCAEAMAGGAALVRTGQALARSGRAPALNSLLERGASISVRTLAQAARAGDAELESVLDSAMRTLGVLVGNLVHTLSPDLVVFGGGWSPLVQERLETVHAEVERRVHMIPAEDLRIEVSALADRAGLLGGLALPDHSPYPATSPPGTSPDRLAIDSVPDATLRRGPVESP